MRPYVRAQVACGGSGHVHQGTHLLMGRRLMMYIYVIHQHKPSIPHQWNSSQSCGNIVGQTQAGYRISILELHSSYPELEKIHTSDNSEE
ncbi:hypothetical protein Cni_G08583 [Canna indica]|uniref:Uncharacterized protein n=1 Tax=Canna indica TaxID=4628 RepID=A0AAQ3K0Q4_9LILI|nr:hypothetical protein Cni_G08583 [Canna indica]